MSDLVNVSIDEVRLKIIVTHWKKSLNDNLVEVHIDGIIGVTNNFILLTKCSENSH